MRRFVICALVILRVARCSAFDIIFPSSTVDLEDSRPQSIQELLKNFQDSLQMHSNDILEKLTAIEATLTESDAMSSQIFEYQVQTEVFKSPLLNHFLKTAEEKMSDFAQIFGDDLALVTNKAKDIINERLDERITALQEAMDDVRSNVEELTGRNPLGELKFNVFNNITSKINEHRESDISLPSKALLANMTNALDRQIKILQDRSNNVSDCSNTEKQIEESVTIAMEYERKFAEAKHDLKNTTMPKCPVMPSRLESAVKINKDKIENISDILKDTEIIVFNSLAKLKSPDFPPAQ